MIRHPGRGGDEEYHQLCAFKGFDTAEDMCRGVFNRESGELDAGIVILERNERIVAYTVPQYLRTFMERAISQEVARRTKECKDACAESKSR